MLHYRGFELIEYVTIHHRADNRRVHGGRGVSVRDDLAGIVSDHRTMIDAQLWIDAQIAIADRLLAKVFA